MKIPFLSRLLEIKEEQLVIENQKLGLLSNINLGIKGLNFKLSQIEARLILNSPTKPKRKVVK